MAVKSYLDQFAKVISDILNIDVLIVDSNLNVLGQKLVYYDMYQKINFGSLLYTVIEGGEHLSVKSRESVPKCKNCKSYMQCKIDGFVGVPIYDKTEVIGALGLMVSKKRGKNFFDKIDSTFQFMDNMAELIAKRIVEHRSKKRLRERLTRVESIIASLPEALLYCDTFGNVIYQNSSLRSTFPLGKEVSNIREISEDLVKYLEKRKNIEEVKITIEKSTFTFYGTVTIVPIIVDEDKTEYLCKFKSYSQIQKESIFFANSTMVTFSWLSKYLGRETVEECKALAESEDCIFIQSEDNALNELVGKAIFNYSNRRLQELRVIYMQNVYRDLMNTFLFDEHGVLWQMQGGSIIIVQPEKMLLSVQENLAKYLEKERERIQNREQEKRSIQFIFCSTENLGELVQKKLFSYKLYTIITQHCISGFQSAYNNRAVFERFFKSGVLYYSKIYGNREERDLEALYRKAWRALGKKDLSSIETYLESYFKNDCATEIEPDYIAEGTVQDIERTRLGQLIKQDYTVQQICDKMGFSRSGFYRKIAKYQLHYKKRRYTK